jgi:hypothetical protein
MLAVILDVHAVLAVYDHTAARGEERKNGVVGNRETATRVRHQQALGARNASGTRRAREGFLAGLGRQQAARHQRRQAFPQSHLFVQLVGVVHAEFGPQRN